MYKKYRTKEKKFLMWPLEFFIDLILPDALWLWGLPWGVKAASVYS
jgi:hypothetical protein